MADLPDWPGGSLPPFVDDFSEFEESGTNYSNFVSSTVDELIDIQSKEQEVAIQGIKHARDASQAAFERGKILFDKEAISEGDLKILESTAKKFEQETDKVLKALPEQFKKMGKLETDLIEGISGGKSAIPTQEAEAAQKAVEETRIAQEQVIKELKAKVLTEEEKAGTVYKDMVKANENYFKLKRELEAAKAEGKEVSSLQEMFDSAYEERKSKSSLYSEAEQSIAALRRNTDIGVKAAESTIAKALDALEASKSFEGAGFVTDKMIQTVAKAISAYVDPITELGSKMKRVSKIISEGYEAFAKMAVEGEDLSRFLQEVNNVTKGEVEKETERMKKQIDRVKEIMSTEAEEGQKMAEMVGEISKWMSPSWKTKAALTEDIIKYVEAFRFSELTNPIIFLIKIAGFAALVVKTAVRGALFAAFKGVEAVAGLRVATVLADTGGALVEGVGKIVGAALAPEVQAVMFAFYAIIDIFRVHNFGSWAHDMLSFITCGLLSDSFNVWDYDEFSSLVIKKKDDKATPDKMWEIDHKEFKSVLDFWGNVYVTERNKILKSKLVYKPVEDWGGITRRTGLYIHPAVHPYDTVEEIEESIRLEKELDLGMLIDETGRATGADPLGHTASNLIPRKPGLIRNMANFPMYSKTMVWPDRNGVFIQTKGQFGKNNIDPTVARLFEHWVKSGTWGDAFSHPNGTDKTKADAIATNKRDYAQYMNPSKDDDFIWTDINNWASNNKGKRVVMSQDMNGITLEVFKKEMKTDLPQRKEGFMESLIADIDLLTHQDTINFVTNFYTITGRYPYTPMARKFYDRVIKEGKTAYLEDESVGMMDNKITVYSIRKSTVQEIGKFKTVVNQIEMYMAKLEKNHGDIQKAWDATFKETLFNAYIADTTPRTIWGYIEKNRAQLMAELQQTVNVMVGKRKAKIWEEYLQRVARAGIPLNTNRYGRLSFVGKFNQLIYAQNPDAKKMIEKQITKIGGKILENRLITTGLSKDDLGSWANGILKPDILSSKSTIDFPVYFGNIHCRVIVIEKPKQTCFVVFRGTTNFWEWVVDLDFSGAEYGSISSGSKPGTFKLELSKSSEWAETELRRLFFGDPDKFAIHRGFLRCWLAFKPTLISLLDGIYEKYNIQDVIVTGHSLGAGITQVACLELPSLPRKKLSTASSLALLSGLSPSNSVEYVRPHAYMYSSPAVGDQRFSWHFENQTSESAHAYIDGDIVTMIPFFLIPAQASWSGSSVLSIFKDIESLAAEEGGTLSTAWTVLGIVFKHSNIPFNPTAWVDKSGHLDWNKVKSGLVEMNINFNKHRAIHGGGVFLRLSNAMDGNFLEMSMDPGSSSDSWGLFAHAVIDRSDLLARHSIDNVVLTLDKVFKKNKDLFATIDENEFPEWGDAGSSKEIRPKPNLPDIPPGGKVVALATSKRKFRPWNALEQGDITDIVMLPDQDEIMRQKKRQNTRKKIRRVTEGDYHGY